MICLLLLQLGGFVLPFMVLGSVMIIVGVISIFILPPQTCKSLLWLLHFIQLVKRKYCVCANAIFKLKIGIQPVCMPSDGATVY